MKYALCRVCGNPVPQKPGPGRPKTRHDHCKRRDVTGQDVALPEMPPPPEVTEDRPNSQRQRVFTCLANHAWWTLRQLAKATGDPEASISARVRDLRKPRFGGFTVLRRRHGDTFEYRMEDPE